MRKFFLFLLISIFSMATEKIISLKSDVNLKTDIIKYNKTYYNLSEISNNNSISLDLKNDINDFSFKILQNNKIDTSKSILNKHFYSLNLTNKLKTPKILKTNLNYNLDVFIGDNEKLNRENLNFLNSLYLENNNDYFNFKVGTIFNNTVNKPLYEYSLFSELNSKYIDISLKYTNLLNRHYHQIKMYNITKKLTLDDGHNHNENNLNIFSILPYDINSIIYNHNNEKYIFSNYNINSSIKLKPIKDLNLDIDFNYNSIEHKLGNYFNQSIKDYNFNIDFEYNYVKNNFSTVIKPEYSLNILKADYYINDIENLNSRYKIENILNHNSIIKLDNHNISFNNILNYNFYINKNLNINIGLEQELSLNIKKFKVKDEIYNNRKLAYDNEVEKIKKYEESLTEEKIKERKKLENEFLNKINKIDEKIQYLNNLNIEELINEYNNNYSNNNKLDENLKNEFLKLFKLYNKDELSKHYSDKLKEYIDFTKTYNIKNSRDLTQAVATQDKEKVKNILKEQLKEKYNDDILEKYYFNQITYISNNGLKSIKSKLDNIFFTLQRERNKLNRDMKTELSITIDENIKNNFEFLNNLQKNIYILDYEINPYLNINYNINQNISINSNIGLNFEYNKILNNDIFNKKKKSYPLNYYINLEMNFNF